MRLREPSAGMKVLILAPTLCCVAALNAAVADARAAADPRMPAVVSVAGRELRLNGTGVHKEKVFFKAYTAWLYLEEPTADAQAAVAAEGAKRLVMVMLRDVSRDQFVKAVEKGIRRNSGPVMGTLRARLDLLKENLPALKKGDILDFTYVPGAGTLVRGQGKEMTIAGKDFADAILSAWLGVDPIDKTLKRQLLGG